MAPNTQDRLYMEAMSLDIFVFAAIEDGQIIPPVHHEDCENILCYESGWNKQNIENFRCLGQDETASNVIIGKCKVDNYVKSCVVAGYCLATLDIILFLTLTNNHIKHGFIWTHTPDVFDILFIPTGLVTKNAFTVFMVNWWHNLSIFYGRNNKYVQRYGFHVETVLCVWSHAHNGMRRF